MRLSPNAARRVWNLSAGPSALPAEVLERARDETLDYAGTGVSVMETSHRSEAFEGILAGAEARLRRLYGLDGDWTVLFLQGGASLQFSMVPMAFLPARAAYALSGAWGVKALAAARLVGPAEALWTDEARGFRAAPELAPGVATGYDYLHVTTNETIGGVGMPDPPPGLGAPVIADASSDFLSRPLDLSRYAMLYAGAQKNLGPAGLTVVLLRNDLLARCRTPHPMLDYRAHARAGSLLNTPPTWSVYVAALVLEWLEGLGGLPEIARRNRTKAALVYRALTGAEGFYRLHADPGARSLMNVVFRLPSPGLEEAFLLEAAANGMIGLRGHRDVGGLRASIYNAFPQEGCALLADLLADFARRKG